MADECIYFVGNTELARGGTKQLPPWSIACFCSGCGQIWGRIYQPNEGVWRAEQCLCMACSKGLSGRVVGGSFLPALQRYPAGLGDDYRWEDHLPSPILAREAALALRWWEYDLARRKALPIMGTGKQ